MAPLQTLRKRADFVNARKGRRVHTPAFLIQVISNDGMPARVGLTVTKKIGGAVARNRVKRRLRSVVRAVMTESARPGTDYVLIARPEALTRPFERLLDDLREALVDRAIFPNGR